MTATDKHTPQHNMMMAMNFGGFALIGFELSDVTHDDRLKLLNGVFFSDGAVFRSVIGNGDSLIIHKKNDCWNLTLYNSENDSSITLASANTVEKHESVHEVVWWHPSRYAKSRGVKPLKATYLHSVRYQERKPNTDHFLTFMGADKESSFKVAKVNDETITESELHAVRVPMSSEMKIMKNVNFVGRTLIVRKPNDTIMNGNGLIGVVKSTKATRSTMTFNVVIELNTLQKGEKYLLDI